jgi:hypothetical protein
MTSASARIRMQLGYTEQRTKCLMCSDVIRLRMALMSTMLPSFEAGNIERRKHECLKGAAH